MGQFRVTQVRSSIGGTQRQRATLRALGLHRIRDVVVKDDRPELRGMAAAVAHLVTVEETEPAAESAPDTAQEPAADTAPASAQEPAYGSTPLPVEEDAP